MTERRVCGPDGLVHRTQAHRRETTDSEVFYMRLFDCSLPSVAMTYPAVKYGETLEEVDVEDAPGAISCFACIAGEKKPEANPEENPFRMFDQMPGPRTASSVNSQILNCWIDEPARLTRLQRWHHYVVYGQWPEEK